MKTAFFIVITVLTFQGLTAQNAPRIDAYPFGSLKVDIKVMPFGMETPIKIGTMSANGELQFDFPADFVVPEEQKDNLSTELWLTLFSKCDNGSEMIAPQDNITSFKTGFISLWTSESRYVGVVFPVSDEALVPWIEDAAYNDPVTGSYYELVYVAAPFQYAGDCISTETTAQGDVPVAYSYQLDLKAGFNFIHVQIEHIHKTDPNERASFPDKIRITNTNNIPHAQWVGKYF